MSYKADNLQDDEVLVEEKMVCEEREDGSLAQCEAIKVPANRGSRVDIRADRVELRFDAE